MLGVTAYKTIEEKRAILTGLAKKIWECPEGPYLEYKACEWSAEVLRDAGFQVETGVGGVPTAIKATFGAGHPVIGFLGEYDALPGLSQKVSTKKDPVIEGGWGHGCGHNLLGVGHIGAVLGMQAEMTEKKLPGTIIYFGCPAEELLTGKVFMARAGVFDGIDAAAAWHPGTMNTVSKGNCASLNTFKLHFKGRTSHAADDPYNGRSALDAVELTNVGAQYLREHVTSDVRIHYVITDGGVAPNIVPDKACVWYYVRAATRDCVEDVYARMIKIAKGAAMMTETELEIEFIGGCYPTCNNHVLVDSIHQCMTQVPRESWTSDEIAFASEINESCDEQCEMTRTLFNLPEDEHIHDGVIPIQSKGESSSTDVGDVAHIAPTVFFYTAAASIGSPGHSWQTAACSGMSIGEKGMIFAAKVMALFGLKILTEPGMLSEAKKEFDLSAGRKPYTCPIPAEITVPCEK